MQIYKQVILLACGWMLSPASLAAAVLYGTTLNSHKVVKIDTTANTVSNLVTVGGNPDSLVLDPTGRLVYDLNDTSELHVYDPVANTDTTIAGPTNGILGPQDMVLDPGGLSVLVSNFTGNKITRTNLTNGITTVLPTPIIAPQGLAYDAGGNLYVVSGYTPGMAQILQIDPTTGATIRASAAFDSTNTLDGMVFDAFSNTLFVTSQGANALWQVDPVTLNATKVATVSLPDGLATDEKGSIYIVSRLDFQAHQYNIQAGTIAAVGPVVPGLDDLAQFTVNPPMISKAFVPSSVLLGGTSTLSFTITNPNMFGGLGGIGFTDQLPAGVQVASPSNLKGGCGGGSITVSSSMISLSDGVLAPTASCTFSVSVNGTMLGPQVNTTGQVTAALSGPGNSATATLNVLGPPQITKSFLPASIPINGMSQLTFSISNPNGGAITGVGFTDVLPGGLTVAIPSGLTGSCGGGTIAASGSTVMLSGAVLPNSGCIFSVNVNGIGAGLQINSVQVISDLGAGNTAMASLLVVAPPTLKKSFGAASIALMGSTTLSFTVTNPNALASLSGLGFSDTLPAGLTIATPNGFTGNACGGTLTANSGAQSILLSGGTLAASGVCSFSINVQGVQAGAQPNQTSAITSVEGGNGLPAIASLAVVAPPSITKAFGTATIAVSTNTTISFTINSPAANSVALSGVGFNDTLPGGFVVATPANLTGSCGGGIVTANPGTGTVSLSGASLTPGGSCTFSVSVTAPNTAGAQTNSVQVTSTNGGNGNTATALINVIQAPSISKSFSPAGIPAKSNSTLTFTITNPGANPVAITGVGFNDMLPAGVVVAATPAVTNTCGGNVTAQAAATSVVLTGVTLPANGVCNVSLAVTGMTSGVKNNSVQVTSDAGPGNTANATLTVAGPPQLTKAFAAQSVPLTGTTSLSFTVTNPNGGNISLTGIGFTDQLPAGLLIATPNGLTPATCGNGPITAVAGTNSIGLSGATLASGASCIFAVNVVGTTAGPQNNTTSAITSNEGGNGSPASANIVVVAPPVITAVFNPLTVPINANSTLSFTIQNPMVNTVALVGVAFSNKLPGGLTIANNGLSGSCGGGPITAAPGTSMIALNGATLNPNTSCTFSVTVMAPATKGTITDTIPVTSSNGGDGMPTVAILNVVGVGNILKTFSSSTLPLNGTVTLNFTITNPTSNPGPLNNAGFVDTLPAGLFVSMPPTITNNCGGALNAGPGSNTIALSGATLPINASCVITVTVTGTSAGLKSNTVTLMSDAGASDPSTATTTVVAPPLLTKVFGAPTIGLNGTTTLTFTVTNPNGGTALSGVAFTDPLPSGLAVATPPGLTGACGAGTVSATAGAISLTLTGGTLAGAGTCTFSVNVTGTVAGTQNNTTSSITSNEGGTGLAASASIGVIAPPVIGKAFGEPTIEINTQTTLAFTITNPPANMGPLNGVSFTDSLPGGLVVASPNGLAGSCGGGTIVATAGTNSVVLSGATLPPGGSCTFSILVQAPGTPVTVTNSVTINSANGGQGNTAMANLTIRAVQPPFITKVFLGSAVALGDSTTLILTVFNQNFNITLTGLAFTDTLPAGLILSTPASLSGSCGGGTITAADGTNFVSLANATLAPGTFCTFSVSVTGIQIGTWVNNTSVVTSTNGGTGNTATATLLVEYPDAYQVRYVSNLDAGDSDINITNAGALGANPYGPGISDNGKICANVYVFSPDEQEIDCCSCLVTPNGLQHFSVQDLIANSLTGVKPTSVVIKLLASIPGNVAAPGSVYQSTPFNGAICNPAYPFDVTNLTPSMRAWGTSLHALPGTTPAYAVGEDAFQQLLISPGELQKLTGLCQFIQGNGSGAGICKGCPPGGLGAVKSSQ